MAWPLFIVALRERRRTKVSNSSNLSVESDGLTPEQRLEPPNTRLINAGIATIHDMETLRACVAYENANQNRTHILRRLEWKARELREDKE
ncbi:MAG: hypothetical protein J07HQW2_03795 [Haloquadratum walsbyi J07HQW2]|uniref:DUF8129 domain-containing protein n=1 Tax=Haloquadratum walsbyi J07HQW2 TaxID=1238425 RepID=U1N335_9EURY|nr:MAG: hypothetical protein J07HQW2_03795 [Haloquadratum walsbyi J07HQW2]